jgi:hypothetical protein
MGIAINTVYQGYGRTRRPKNIAGPDGTAVATLADIAAAANAANVASTYRTENQRFLHLATGAGTTIAQLIMVFSFASGVWSTLDLGAVVAANTYRVVEIDGIDRVAFTLAGNPGTNAFAACTTF